MDLNVLMLISLMNQTIYLSTCLNYFFYQDQNKRRHKLLPIEVSKNNSDRDIDFLIYKNHYRLI